MHGSVAVMVLTSSVSRRLLISAGGPRVDQVVSIQNEANDEAERKQSTWPELQCGVLQDSVLVPIIFLL